MKAAQWDPKQKKMVVNELPIPEPGENQFLVKMASASLCHSDIMAIEAPREEPVTIGHEGVGYVQKLHPSAEGKGFKEGDAVGFLYIIGCCFECEGCMIHNLSCSSGKQLLQGFTTDGFFAEYAVVDYHNAIILPKSLDIKSAAPIFCAGITAFHSVDSCELKPGDWLGVIGCGGLGQLATQYAKAMGCHVVGIDVNDEVLSQCKAQGADATFNSITDKNYVEELRKLTNGGVKAAAVFSNADAAYSGAPPIIRNGGVLMVVGLPKNNLSISSMDLALGRYKVKSESTSIPQRMGKAVEFTAKHNIHPEVEMRSGLESVQDMVDTMKKGKNIKRMAVVF
ncbi:alcohol dehydrogenase [Tricladium varicosporioides]|nr:alcohol dehydrogenase [Hymenoscyphus varicosporioides]